jgi:chaperonin cofactor prefoldin
MKTASAVKRIGRRISLLLGACCALGWVSAGLAQTERAGGGGANAALAQQYQQAMAQQSTLQAENTKLKKSADDLKKQLDAANKQLAGLKAGSTHGQAALLAAQHESETANKNLEDLKAKAQELVGHYHETIANLRTVETDRTQLRRDLADSKTQFDHCAASNYDLYKINGEILDRYEHQGMFSYMERSEPFTRLKRTQIQNIADEYKERAEELRVQPQSANAAAAGALATAPAAAKSAGAGPATAAPPANNNTSAPAPAPTPKKQ